MNPYKLFYQKKIQLSSIILFIFSTISYSQDNSMLKLDPDLLVMLKESQNIHKQLDDKLFPNWEFNKTPILFYKPKCQELLVNFPHKPKGFEEYKGFNPLTNQPIYVRNDKTFFDWDDQNTTTEIDGVKVLVVADTYSSMRAQLRGAILNQSKDFLNTWLDNWDFIGSPYHKISTILHEGFHVYQEQLAEGKNANEGTVALYPLLNPTNNSLSVIEGLILKDALTAKNQEVILEKAKQFIAVRSHRQALLDSVFVAYENLNEFSEGTAKYIEFKFFSQGEALIPIDEMKYVNGFTDYKKELPAFFNRQLEDLVNIVAVNDNRFGNKFGAGPLRFKLYYLGACQGLLLDKILPKWKEQIFDKGIYLSDLLEKTIKLSDKDKKRLLDITKIEYNYDKIFKEKIQFESEGQEMIKRKVDAILKTEETLVIIDYKGHKYAGMNYTPFGVTRVDANSTIYEMTPIGIYFDKIPELKSKMVFPVLLNKKQQKIYFSISTSIEDFKEGLVENSLSVKEFEFIADEINVKKEGNRIIISFK